MKRRIFIAINLSREIKKNIEGCIKRLKIDKYSIKWAEAQNIHITLVFLGMLKDREVAKLTAIVKLLTKNQKKIKLYFRNIGFFPSVRLPKIIYINIADNFSLLDLQKKINHNLALKGFQIEKRSFVPHITIGRVKDKIKNIKGLLEEAKNIKLNNVLVSNIDIMESVLEKEGPEYRIIFRINLQDK